MCLLVFFLTESLTLIQVSPPKSIFGQCYHSHTVFRCSLSQRDYKKQLPLYHKQVQSNLWTMTTCLQWPGWINNDHLNPTTQTQVFFRLFFKVPRVVLVHRGNCMYNLILYFFIYQHFYYFYHYLVGHWYLTKSSMCWQYGYR